MRLPRDLSGDDLIKALSRVGYALARQRSSHATLTRVGPPDHSITVPMHNPIKVGTLNAILRNVTEHLHITRDELLETIFA